MENALQRNIIIGLENIRLFTILKHISLNTYFILICSIQLPQIYYLLKCDYDQKLVKRHKYNRIFLYTLVLKFILLHNIFNHCYSDFL